MTENQQMIIQLAGMIASKQTGVLATVVSVEGSAYKREGAKMLIRPDGEYQGMISGGCLEGDAVASAESVFQSGQSLLKKYELDEELVWGLGLGCPGIVEILLEPIGLTPDWQQLADIYNNGESAVICKLLQDGGSTAPFLLVTTSHVYGSWEDEFLQENVLSVAEQKLSAHGSLSESMVMITGTGEQVRVFFDVHFPPPRLCIFGAGHDAVPLARLSTMLGYETAVVDPRPAYNTKERFPGVFSLLAQPSQYETIHWIDSHTFIVIMNHHLERDTEALIFALRSAAHYVGVLGPKRRREKILERLKEQGIVFSKEQLEKLFSPIGLDIGAESSEEIALSIMAEITAIRRSHKGGFLKDRLLIHKKPSGIEETEKMKR